MSSNAVKKGKCGVFIDGSNLFSSQYQAGWWISFKHFKEILKKRYKPLFYNYYGCVDNVATEEKYKKSAEGQKRFFNKLAGMGYNMVTKDIKKIVCGDGSAVYKCDMDINIALDVEKVINDIDVVVLVSGDSDFLPLIERSFEAGKFIRIYAFRGQLSWELKNFAITHPRCNYIFIDDLKGELDRSIIDPPKELDTKEE